MALQFFMRSGVTRTSPTPTTSRRDFARALGIKLGRITKTLLLQCGDHQVRCLLCSRATGV